MLPMNTTRMGRLGREDGTALQQLLGTGLGGWRRTKHGLWGFLKHLLLQLMLLSRKYQKVLLNVKIACGEEKKYTTPWRVTGWEQLKGG